MFCMSHTLPSQHRYLDSIFKTSDAGLICEQYCLKNVAKTCVITSYACAFHVYHITPKG